MQKKAYCVSPSVAKDHTTQARTLTIRFIASDNRPQSELKDEIDKEVDQLFRTGVLRNIRLEPVFPGDETLQWRGVFVMSFVGDHELVIKYLKMVVGVRSVYLIPERRAL